MFAMFNFFNLKTNRSLIFFKTSKTNQFRLIFYLTIDEQFEALPNLHCEISFQLPFGCK